MYWNNTVETESLANHQIVSDCFGQHWTISGTNLNAVWSSKKNAHHWKTVHYWSQNKHIQLTAFPEMPIVAQLIKIFPRISWNLRFTTVYSAMLSWCMISQNPFWYRSLKSISISSSLIHNGLLNGLFPSPFSIQKSVQDYICLPCMLHY